jgi:hypothetical protein
VKTAAYRTKKIKIIDISFYAFSDDAPLKVWAAGAGGWYELQTPTKHFEEVFLRMKEAVAMIYFLADRYRNARITSSSRALKEQEKYVKKQFTEFLSTEYCIRTDKHDVIEGFHSHRDFLIKSMLDGHDGLAWEASPVLKYYKRHFPEAYAAAVVIVGGKSEDSAVEEEKTEVVTSQVQAKTKGSHSSTVTNKKTNGLRASKMTPIETESEEENEDEDVAGLKPKTPARESPVAGKRKSVLRPKSNQASKKYTLRRTRGQEVSEHEGSSEENTEDEGDEDMPMNPTPSKVVKKERTSLIEEILSVNPQLASDLPGYYRPNLPGDTWQCPYDGCTRKVWDASTLVGIEIIKTHFSATHAETAEDLISSEARPWVSVDHLLERVKGITGLQAEMSSLGGGFPKPIIRRY